MPECARGRSQCALAAATLGPRLQPERRGGERGGEGRSVLGGGVAMLGLHVPVAWPLRQESSPLPARHVPPIKRATTSPGVNDASFSRHIATSFISLGLLCRPSSVSSLPQPLTPLHWHLPIFVWSPAQYLQTQQNYKSNLSLRRKPVIQHIIRQMQAVLNDSLAPFDRCPLDGDIASGRHVTV